MNSSGSAALWRLEFSLQAAADRLKPELQQPRQAVA
jgi:hypothetical protein